MKIRNITFTGVDIHTQNNEIRALAEQAVMKGFLIEWGMLYSPSAAGSPGRYDMAENIVSRLMELNDQYLAVHFCGRSISQLLLNDSNSDSLKILEAANSHTTTRVQLNFNQKVSNFDPLSLLELFERFPSVRFIVQHNKNNRDLISELAKLRDSGISSVDNLQILFDASGGRGIYPTSWPSPEDACGLSLGYAGGLNGGNIFEKSNEIERESKGVAAWLDLESGLRNQDDIFCTNLCQKVFAGFSKYVNTQTPLSSSIFEPVK